MAKKESLQHKLDRVRSPRVQITYDVEIGGAIENKEIPFVAGVLADLSGKPSDPLPKLKDRKFVEIDRDNFNRVLDGMKPRVAFKVDNKLGGKDDSQIGVELKFKSMDDFHPEQVAMQVDPLRKLIEARKKLSELRNKLDGNDKLDELLQDVLSSTESLTKLGKETGAAGGPEGENK
jgi:type VI secretion system protein ImpB